MDLATSLKAKALDSLLHLPRFAKRRIAGKPIQIDGLELDLDMQLLVKLSNLEKPVRPSHHPKQLHASRKSFNASTNVVAGKTIPMDTRNLQVGLGEPRLPARLYTPENNINALVFFLHGGGWVHGNLDTHDNLCRCLAQVTGAKVLSVEYQKAPENPWPTAVDDVLRAYQDIVIRLHEFGLDNPVIAVAGDSAGAKLATVLARKLSHMEIHQPIAQLLIYPSADSPRQGGSRELFKEGFLLTGESISIYQDCYIPKDQDHSHPDISPLYAEDIEKQPTAIVVTAGFDPLRDEGRDYAKKLEQAGVPVKWIEYPGMVHGFANILVADSARHAVEEMARVLRSVMQEHA